MTIIGQRESPLVNTAIRRRLSRIRLTTAKKTALYLAIYGAFQEVVSAWARELRVHDSPQHALRALDARRAKPAIGYPERQNKGHGESVSGRATPHQLADSESGARRARFGESHFSPVSGRKARGTASSCRGEALSDARSGKNRTKCIPRNRSVRLVGPAQGRIPPNLMPRRRHTPPIARLPQAPSAHFGRFFPPSSRSFAHPRESCATRAAPRATQRTERSFRRVTCDVKAR